MKIIFIALIFLIALTVFAHIFEYRDINNNIIYSDLPPPSRIYQQTEQQLPSKSSIPPSINNKQDHILSKRTQTRLRVPP